MISPGAAPLRRRVSSSMTFYVREFSNFQRTEDVQLLELQKDKLKNQGKFSSRGRRGFIDVLIKISLRAVQARDEWTHLHVGMPLIGACVYDDSIFPLGM